MKELTNALLKAVRLEEKLTGTPIDELLKQQLTMWGAGIFRLVVMGEIKKGKSSFINAMLGERDLVPVSSDVATSTIFKIRYGKDKGYVVHFTAESGKKPLPIDGYDLPRFGTEDGNPGNRDQVDFIEVICPSPLLQSGIVIIDTPGLGGLFKSHKQITWEYVPRADAVFFVTDSVESPIGQLETDYLKQIKSITPYVYFVQTKIFAVDSEAKNARKRNNLSILSRCLDRPEKEIPYFLVDSELRFEADEHQDMEDLQDSGYPQLMAFVKNVLQGNQQEMLAARALVATQPIIAHLQELISSRKELINADTEEKRKRREDEIVRLQEELRSWQEKKQPEIMNELQKGLQIIRLEAMKLGNKCRPAGEIQCVFEDMIYQTGDIETLGSQIEEINMKLPEFVSSVIQQTARKVQEEAEGLLNRLADGQSAELSSERRVDEFALRENINTRALLRVKEAFGKDDTFQTLRTGLYGGMAGMGIATIAGGIIGSVIPVVGTIIGSSLGMMIAGAWGGKKAFEYQQDQELRAARQQACGAIAQAMSSAYGHIQSTLDRLLVGINSETSKTIQNFVRSRSSELSKQMEELRDRSRMDGEELNKRKLELAVLERDMEDIKRHVAPYIMKVNKATATS